MQDNKVKFPYPASQEEWEKLLTVQPEDRLDDIVDLIDIEEDTE